MFIIINQLFPKNRNEMNVYQFNCHLPFELPVQIPVQLLLELEANLLDQNVNELEFELSRM